MNSVKATKWLTELNISDKNPFEYNSVTKNFWCKPCKKAISADQKIQLKQHRESEKHRSNLSCDVKRSFSVYKNILNERRHNLMEKNLGKMIVCNCYYNRE